ncbi:hypothetical protein C4D60_Mb02t17920 [Musa balbisiana]|uniref:Uncharacterized protein n=1 Tax=Musa balbisiana TaxID=52838 RepID=A0A4V4H2S2_MUSBA|nr:hypothetical protein C4D60_Mb02t17920 [Musa balbisiana]
MAKRSSPSGSTVAAPLQQQNLPPPSHRIQERKPTAGAHIQVKEPEYAQTKAHQTVQITFRLEEPVIIDKQLNGSTAIFVCILPPPPCSLRHHLPDSSPRLLPCIMATQILPDSSVLRQSAPRSRLLMPPMVKQGGFDADAVATANISETSTPAIDGKQHFFVSVLTRTASAHSSVRV